MSGLPAKPVPPEKPLPSDCCDSGCDRCVHDIYAEELAHYEQRLAAWQAANCDTASTAGAQTGGSPHLADDPPHPIKGA